MKRGFSDEIIFVQLPKPRSARPSSLRKSAMMPRRSRARLRMRLRVRSLRMMMKRLARMRVMRT